MTAPVREIGVLPAEEKDRLSCIELLEKLLSEAKSGRGFESVFLLATYPDSGAVRQAWTRSCSTLGIVGRLEHLKHEILATMHEGTAEGSPR